LAGSSGGVAFANVDSMESGAKEEGAALVSNQGNSTRKDKSRITCFMSGKKGTICMNA
jgi:hypothetical protein